MNKPTAENRSTSKAGTEGQFEALDESSDSRPDPPNLEAGGIEPLLQLIRILRGPLGCPWDQEQTLEKTRPNLIEEAHEVAAALDSGDALALKEELGDLLFQVAFIAALAADENQFTFEQVVHSVTEKMVARHPHVFEATNQELTSEDVKRQWQQRKRARGDQRSILDGIPPSMPELTAAFRMTEKAAGLGFDWPSVEPVFDKIQEEISELRSAIAETSVPRGLAANASESVKDAGDSVKDAGDSVKDAGDSVKDAGDSVEEELGDLLFTVVNLARHLGKDPARALSRTNQKFRSRFAYVEQNMPEDSDLASLQKLWNDAKKR